MHIPSTLFLLLGTQFLQGASPLSRQGKSQEEQEPFHEALPAGTSRPALRALGPGVLAELACSVHQGLPLRSSTCPGSSISISLTC